MGPQPDIVTVVQQRALEIATRFPHLGCSRAHFIKWIESQWSPGMSWMTYGRHGWHIDHVKPRCDTNFIDENAWKKFCHYTNLRPLWASENCAQRSRRPGVGEDRLRPVPRPAYG